MQDAPVISRLAPTPSGFLHQGNAANFALNARLAGSAGRLYLRIDDLDRGRFREEYLVDIFRVIDWLGITVTDGPGSPEDFHARWSQQFRLKDYEEALLSLRGHPLLFACPCSRKELAQGDHAYGCLSGKISLDAEGVAWRINTRELASVFVPDLVQPKSFTVDLHQEMPDFAVRKKDGKPSYQTACVADDVLFNVNRVGRGEDLLASTAAQAVLSDLLGYGSLFDRIAFLHHPLVSKPGGEKLSKSAGARGVSTLESLRPEDIFVLAESWMKQPY
ncbi:glutamate--tRNA ligase family protein [Neolewinella agarilytica]|uniref:Glutamyl-tRNA synthetase n=1 Tax=Neolewinella agarilytica TaxID=478744 RepID=A0A1H9CFT6_9BACT|nr:glutamate--tRNA ligase family protein [Neolewinella agarilytica]SEQ00029.1 glutamyl-tRNA synthetase [Neolewinella agarilytica]